MSGRNATTSEEEIVPIRQAGENTRRNYDTNTTLQPNRGDGTDHAANAISEVTPTAPAASTNEASSHDNSRSEPTKSRRAWLKDLAGRYGSITLENKGSVARDHLALERTFLAWLRTSLAFASIGIAITQLFRLNTSLSQHARTAVTISPTVSSTLPFSPFMGHSIPADVAPYLQDILASSRPSPTPALGPTLFDQIFKLTANGERVQGFDLVANSATGSDYRTDSSDSKIKHLGKPLGATFIGVSIVILLVGFHRYFESQYWIIKGKFPASRGSVAFVGLLTAALIITCLVVIVVVDPRSYERKKR